MNTNERLIRLWAACASHAAVARESCYLAGGPLLRQLILTTSRGGRVLFTLVNYGGTDGKKLTLHLLPKPEEVSLDAADFARCAAVWDDPLLVHPITLKEVEQYYLEDDKDERT